MISEGIWVVLGVTLVVAGFVDVVMTVLYYDEAGLLSNRLYRITWRMLRRATAWLPDRPRSLALSLGIPAMILGTLLLWLGLIILGFALLYMVGMGHGAFDLRPGLEPSFGRALYLSGVSMSTLGYGDVTPISGLYQGLSFVQALIGFTILTLAISYVVNIYQILREISALGADLYHQAGDRFDVRAILESHLRGGRPEQLGTRLLTLHRGLVRHYEGLRHFPICYYFYSRRLYPTLPYVLRAVGTLIGALRWSLPRGHPVVQDPWLEALTASYEGVIEDVQHRFLRKPVPIEEVSFASVEEFQRAVASGEAPGDPWLQRFARLERWMHDVLQVEEPGDPWEAHERYERWLPFARRARAVAEAAAVDLGLDPRSVVGTARPFEEAHDDRPHRGP